MADIVAAAAAAVIVTASHARCTLRHALTAATRHRFRSSLAKTALYTVATATSHRVLPAAAQTVVAVAAAVETAADVAHAGKHSRQLKQEASDMMRRLPFVLPE